MAVAVAAQTALMELLAVSVAAGLERLAEIMAAVLAAAQLFLVLLAQVGRVALFVLSGVSAALVAPRPSLQPMLALNF
jgi:hypothetical protein